jgi:hypothetical protein
VWDFANFVLSEKRGKNKGKTYQTFATKGGISVDLPSDTILHDDNRHQLTGEQWKAVLDSIDNIENAAFSKKKGIYGDTVLLRIKTADGDYGLAIDIAKGRNIITTAFKDNGNSIDSWIKENAGRPQSAAANSAQAVEFDISGQPAFNEIISELKQNVNENQPVNPSIVNGVMQAAPNLNNLIKAFPNRDIKKEILAALDFVERVNKSNLLDSLLGSIFLDFEVDPFIRNAFLYVFVQDTQAGITQFINTFAAKGELYPDLTNADLISQSLTEQYQNKTFGKTNPQPIFNQDGVAMQPEMKAVFLAEAHKATMNLFNQTDVEIDESAESELFRKSYEEKEQIVLSELNRLIGLEVETADNKIIGFNEYGNKHAVSNLLNQNGPEQRRRYLSVKNIKSIIKKSKQDGEPVKPKLDHNKNPDVLKHKAEEVESYSRFKVNVKIGNDIISVILTTERLKNDNNPKRSYLYEVSSKKSDSRSDIGSGAAAFDVNITDNNADVKFKNWFGESKVVDEDGEPLVVRHWTAAKFDTFDKNRIGEYSGNLGFYGFGFYFAPMDSEYYSSGSMSGNIGMEVYLSLQNPFIINQDTNYQQIADMVGSDREYDPSQTLRDNIENVIAGNEIAFTEALEDKGFDGVMQYDGDTLSEIVAFSPTQIKSATNNNGNYDPNNPNIYHQSAVVQENFQPNPEESANFRAQVDKSLRDELPANQILKVGSKTPRVYEMLGMPNKPLGMFQRVLRKIIKDKHKVSSYAVKRFPELLSDPMMVLQSTEPGFENSLIAIIDAKDANNNQVVVVIRPGDKYYNLIPSAYGKEEFDKFLESNLKNIRYMDKERAARIARTQHLRDAVSNQDGVANNILQKSDLVKKFNQEGRTIAGSFEKRLDKLIINLFKEANPTTFSHEFFHLTNTFMIDNYNAGNLTDYWNRQTEILAKEVGATRDENGHLVFDRSAMEKGAELFVDFLRTGKLQNRELAPMMAFIKNLFAKIYRALGMKKGFVNKRLANVFESIVSGQEAAESAQRNALITAIEKPAHADDALYDLYKSLILTGRAKAADKYTKAVAQYAEDIVGKEYNDVREARYREILEALIASEPYQIKEVYESELRRGTSEMDAMNMLVMQYADTYSPDDITQFINQEAAEAIANEQADYEMSEAMARKYHLDEESLADAAIRKSADKAKALLAESLLMKGGTIGDFEREWIALKKSVDATIAAMPMKKLADRIYWRDRENLATERYARYRDSGQMKKAASERRMQAIITMIRTKSDVYENRMTRFLKKAKMYRGEQKVNIMGADSYDLLQSILADFGFKGISKRRRMESTTSKLEAWIDRMEREFLVDIGRLRPTGAFILQGFDGNLAQMQAGMFDKLDIIFTAIDQLSRNEWKIEVAEKAANLEDLATETKEHIKKIKFDGEKPETWGQKIKSAFILGRWTNPEPLLRQILPKNAVLKIINPLFDAYSRMENMLRKWQDEWESAKKLVDISSIKTTLAGKELMYRDVADLMLSMGNDHALLNMQIKLGIDEAQANAIASEALKMNPKYAEFMNKVWAMYSETAEHLQKSLLENRNKLLIEKNPRKFKINGVEFAGGYVPERKDMLVLGGDDGFMSKIMGQLASEKIITKDADGNMRSVVDTTTQTLYAFSRAAFIRTEYNNALKYFGNMDVRNTLGEVGAQFVDRWLDRIRDARSDGTTLTRAISKMQNVAILGFSCGRLLVQATGIAQGIAYVGKSNWAQSAFNTLKPNNFMNIFTIARGKSEYMRARYENPIEAIFGVKSGNAKTRIEKIWGMIGIWPLTLGDAFASVTTWDAAYNKARQSGLSEKDAA